MRLSKLHGLGNDFLVLLDDGQDHVDAAGPGLAKAVCDRRTGIGADGLLRSARTPAGITFELWNADGSVAEMSGNGIRCLALAARRAGWWPGADPLVVHTPTGDRTVEWVGGDDDACECRVDMGELTPKVGQWGDAVVEGAGVGPDGTTLSALTVDIGNPHLVLLQDDDHLPAPSEVEADVLQLERTFPDGVNIEIVVRGPGEGEVSMIVHERGAGWTQACGTGSCAVAYAARAGGWAGDRVVVHNPGGAVTVDLDGSAARLTGPAVHIADLTIGAARG